MTKMLIIGDNGEYEDWEPKQIAICSDSFDIKVAVKEFWKIYNSNYLVFECRVRDGNAPWIPKRGRIFYSIFTKDKYDSEKEFYDTKYYGGLDMIAVSPDSEEIPEFQIDQFVYYSCFNEFMAYCEHKGYILERHDANLFWH